MLIRFSLVLFFLLLQPNLLINAAEMNSWNGKRAAVILTYDDSLNVHLDKVIPALDKRGMHATFYLTINPSAFSERIDDWKKAAAKGHELGNHSVFHPCAGNLPGREWVSPDYDLSKYSVQRMLDEITLTNRLLASVDGLKDRTFAYTCGDTAAGTESFVDQIKPQFVAARGVANSFTTLESKNFYNINAFGVNENKSEDLIANAQKAINDGTMIVFLFHGVGGEHNINVSEQAHTELLDFLQSQQDKIWLTTMVKAAKFLKSR